MALFSVITGLDGSGTSTVAKLLAENDCKAKIYDSIMLPFLEFRGTMDKKIMHENIFSHYFFYLSALAYVSEKIKVDLKNGYNVFCVRYLIDTVVSHRVHGMEVALDYSTCGYDFVKPDYIFFLEVDESGRQERISKREKGKNNLDKSLDDNDFRKKFIYEFNRFEKEICRINNNLTLEDTLLSIQKIIKKEF